MILHVIPDEKFITYLKSSFEEAAPSRNIWRILSNKSSLEFTLQDEYTKHIAKNYFASGEFESDLSRVKCVIFHTVGVIQAKAALHIPDDITVIWRGWGYDYYGYMQKKIILPESLAVIRKYKYSDRRLREIAASLYIKLIYPRLFKKFIRRIDYFSCCVPDDFEVLKKEIFMSSVQFLPINYYSIEDSFSKGKGGEGRDILLGNSSTPTNNHIEALNFLKDLDLQGRKVIVPLSYGDVKYRESILYFGKKILGEAFVPIVDYMPLDKYNSIVSSCGYMIMNHVRQQAMGNISLALYRGMRVFLRPENTIYKYFTRLGVKITPISHDLPLGTFDVKLTDKEVLMNKEIMLSLWSRKVGIKQIKKIFN